MSRTPPSHNVHTPSFPTRPPSQLSPPLNQAPGGSARVTVTNHEVMGANAARRALRHGEREGSPRVSDLEALPASMMGKIEIEALEEGRDAQIAENLVKAAVLTVFKDRFTPERFRPIVAAFEEGTVIHAGEDVTSSDYVALLEQQRSEERRVGKGVVSTCRSRGCQW